MFIRAISLCNYGPFKASRDGWLNLSSCNRLKRNKDSIIDNTYVPLALIYGQNLSGKTCLISLLKELKEATKISGYVDVPHKYVRTDGSLYNNEIYFGDFVFTMTRRDRYKYCLKKGTKKLISSDSLKDILNFSNNGFKPLQSFLDRLYYLDETSTISGEIEQFLIDNLELVSRVMKRADMFLDSLEYDKILGLIVKFTNGMKLSVSVVNTSVKRLLMLMPLFIEKSPYDVFVLDDFLDCFHQVLQQQILESHVVFREEKKQLIVTTNNARHMRMLDYYEFLRRDEVYIIDSHRDNESSVQGLIEYIRPKCKLDTETDYLMGRYGGTPIVISLDTTL